MASSLTTESLVCTPSIVFPPAFPGYNPPAGFPQAQNFRPINPATFYFNSQFYSQENLHLSTSFNNSFHYPLSHPQPAHSKANSSSPLTENKTNITENHPSHSSTNLASQPSHSTRRKKVKNYKKRDIFGVFPCPICGKIYSSRQRLRYHTRTCRVNSGFMCSVCNRGFSSDYKLEEHMKVHSEERPYSCDSCSLRFTQRNHLSRHEQTHTGEKPFHCPVCHKQFGRKDKLQRHQNIHSGMRNFSCFLCPKAFYRKDKLFNHFRTHRLGDSSRCILCSESLGHCLDLRDHRCKAALDSQQQEDTSSGSDEAKGVTHASLAMQLSTLGTVVQPVSRNMPLSQMPSESEHQFRRDPKTMQNSSYAKPSP